MKAIPTKYKGYKFRSRLEARYAVLFDVLGWDWEYETEGFELESGRYLPDFYFPRINCYAEVKAKKIEGRDLERLIEFSYSKPILALEGTPEYRPYELYIDGVPEQDVIFMPLGDKYYPFYYTSSFCENYFNQTFDCIGAARSASFEFGEEGAQ